MMFSIYLHNRINAVSHHIVSSTLPTNYFLIKFQLNLNQAWSDTDPARIEMLFVCLSEGINMLIAQWVRLVCNHTENSLHYTLDLYRFISANASRSDEEPFDLSNNDGSLEWSL